MCVRNSGRRCVVVVVGFMYGRVSYGRERQRMEHRTFVVFYEVLYVVLVHFLYFFFLLDHLSMYV